MSQSRKRPKVPEADYYVLAASDYDSRELFACRLCEKAVEQGLKVHIRVDNDADLNQLDSKLWSFRADSFVPHVKIEEDQTSNPPVTLGVQAVPNHQSGLLINLATDTPTDVGEFDRVAEIVSQDEKILSMTRQSFAERRTAGWQVRMIDLRKRG